MLLSRSKPVIYEYQAYPKWVTAPDGTSLLANSEDDEATILSGGHVAQPKAVVREERIFNAPLPPYAIEDYPKWVNGKIVNSPDEERDAYSPTSTEDARNAFLKAREEETKAFAAKLFGQTEVVEDAPEAPAMTDERKMLLDLAELSNIKVDKRWGIERLREALDGK